jgi:hypothetical protein
LGCVKHIRKQLSSRSGCWLNNGQQASSNCSLPSFGKDLLGANCRVPETKGFPFSAFSQQGFLGPPVQVLALPYKMLTPTSQLFLAKVTPQPIDYRGLEFMDIIGDFGGRSTFAIDGDSLLIEVPPPL